MSQLITAELWGGPRDGDRIECLPAPAMVSLYHDPVSGADELAIETADLDKFDGWTLAGFYVHSDPKRLTWSPVQG